MDSVTMRKALTSKRVDRYQHGSDIGIDLAACPPFLQVIVDALVADSCQ
jgi:hypothetical protein